MIKKISTYIFLITFSSVVSAQEILMDCKTGQYRYINNDSGTEILFMHKKRDKGKFAGWCPAEVNEKNKSWFVSVKDHNLLISENKGICMVSEGKFKMANGKVGIVRSSTSVVDFTKKTYTAEFFWMDEKKKFKKTTKCKIVKS